MKKLLMALLVMVGLGYLIGKLKDNNFGQVSMDKVTESSPTQMSVQDKMENLNLATGEYKYILVKVADINKLRLYANFDNPLGTENLIRRDECTLLVNGGFYSKTNEPIGWFYTQGEEVSKVEQNELFNGFVSVATDSAMIASTREMDELVSGVQSGPLLVENGELRMLAINNDEARRRVVAMTNEDGELYFGVVTGIDSLYSGPNLEDLGSIVKAMAQKEEVEMEGAINLDGGSASAFYDGDIYIRETTYIGSYFCVRQ